MAGVFSDGLWVEEYNLSQFFAAFFALCCIVPQLVPLLSRIVFAICRYVYPSSFIANTLGSNPCTCVYGLDIKRPSCCSFDFLNSTTGGCFLFHCLFFCKQSSSWCTSNIVQQKRGQKHPCMNEGEGGVDAGIARFLCLVFSRIDPEAVLAQNFRRDLAVQLVILYHQCLQAFRLGDLFPPDGAPPVYAWASR